METVISVLNVMGKATAREIAARLKIEPVEALTMLREQEEIGVVTFINGYWDIASNDAPVPKVIMAPAVTPKKTTPLRKNAEVFRGAEPAPVTPQMVIELLTEKGSMNTSDLAELLKRNPRGLGTTLRHFSDRGLIVKNGSGKGVKWGLSDETTITTAPAFAELPEIEITPEVVMPPAPTPSAEQEHARAGTEIFLDSIPVLKKPSQPMQIPSLREISNQIRKVKSNLHGLEKLRTAVREVNKHRRALSLFTGEDL